MTATLADGNLLIALAVRDHVHHDAALDWFESDAPVLATCPITEGTLIRFLLREGSPTTDAIGALEAIRSQSWHRFWTDAIPYEASQLGGVIGHRQVTDAYLVALAKHHEGQLATFDRGLAALHDSRVHLLVA